MERRILESSKMINTYSYIYKHRAVSKDKIIEMIEKLDVRESLAIIRMLLNDINRQYYYKMVYFYKNKGEIRNTDYFENLLFSKQGLWYTAKWLLAHGNFYNTNKLSIINNTMEVLHIQLMVVDYLDSNEINPLRYIYKNLHLNNSRNIVNDVSRAVYLYSELSEQKDLYEINEYVDINFLFNKKYGYTIKEYISMIFSLYYFHIDGNGYKIMDKKSYIKDIKNKEKLSIVIDEISHKYYEYSKWAKESLGNSWDYEEFVKYPMIQIYEGLYISLDEKFIVNKFFESLYYKIVDVYSDNKDRAKIITFLGRPFENYIATISEEAVKNNNIGFRFIDEFKYGKNDEKSSDAYIILDDAMIIVEAKSTRPVRSTFISEDEEKIGEAIIKLYSKPALQANNAYECIMKSDHRNKFDNINRIYIITVSLESVPFIREVKQKSDEQLNGKLNNKVKGYCNFNIEEFELLCTLINNDVNVIDILHSYCVSDDSNSLINFVDQNYLNFKMDFITNNFEKFALEMKSLLFK